MTFVHVVFFQQDCPNGQLSRKKFIEVYKQFFPSGHAEKFCDHVFRTFDQDNSGNIDFQEFLLAINVTSSGTPDQKLKWAFRMYDIDNSGSIELSEMVKIIQVKQLPVVIRVVSSSTLVSLR